MKNKNEKSYQRSKVVYQDIDPLGGTTGIFYMARIL
ncbi:hypothetical protein OXPF_05010 [Oxobacter pfennigii]|uniref:Uncharacterized protein n=1 Tax=Oxobacter pfennigii TaxID=36849 RepID=A0A0P9AL20_9CLOT|nr:hypothetical protein OXPF_05010 [Oxobacter pfennigii]